MPETRALVVDDDRSIRFVVRRALAERGWVVVEAEDGDEVEARLVSERFHLVVLDLYMAGMNGFEVLRRLRDRQTPRATWKTRPDVKVLVVSGAPPEEQLAFARRIGADQCLQKPFDVNELLRLVEGMMG